MAREPAWQFKLERDRDGRVTEGKIGDKTIAAILNAHSVHSDCLSSIGWGHCDAPSSLSRGVTSVLDESLFGVVLFWLGGVVPLQLVRVWQVASGGFLLAWGQFCYRLSINHYLETGKIVRRWQRRRGWRRRSPDPPTPTQDRERFHRHRRYGRERGTTRHLPLAC